MDQIMSDANTSVIDLVDELRSLGLPDEVPLPQLIVVGDQSAGKSSVLEAISSIKFPANAGQCTRFPTQLTLKRSPQETYNVSIEPGRTASPELRSQMKSFKPSQASIDDMAGLIAEATAVMNLDMTTALSDHTLKIEISGPTSPHLTLVDLPGLIKSVNDGEPDSQIEVIEALVQTKMNEDSSIILAVISAGYDFQNQTVLRLARANDPKGERTLAVVTKPDLLEGRSTLQDRLKYIQNKKIYLNLGWHVVRNANSEAPDAASYDQAASESVFFSRDPWNSLLDDHVGIVALRKRLSDCLAGQISKALPTLTKQIELRSAKYAEKLKKLKEERTSIDAQRRYISDIAEKFQIHLRDGLQSQYTDKSFFSGLDTHLRARIKSLEDQFATQMRLHGRRYDVQCAHPHHRPRELFPLPLVTPMEAQPIDRWPKYEPSMTIDCIPYTQSVATRILTPNRGPELQTTLNPMLIGNVFQDLSSRWGELAHVYANLVFDEVRSFVTRVFCRYADQHSYSMFMSNIIGPKLEKMKSKLDKKVDEVLAPYLGQHPMSCNPALLDFLLRVYQACEPPKSENSDLLEATYNSGSQILVHQAMAYYEIVQYNMIDNMMALAIENCLLRKVKKLFTPSQVLAMDANLTALVGGEKPEVTAERVISRQKLHMLESALKKCKEHENMLRFRISHEPQAQCGPDTSTADFVTRPDSTSSQNSKIMTTRANKAVPQIKQTQMPEPIGRPRNDLENHSRAASPSGRPLTPVPRLSPAASLSSSYSPVPTPSPRSPSGLIFKHSLGQPAIRKVSIGDDAESPL